MPRKPKPSAIRKICFVTGTRAEFGLMQKTLRAIQDHPQLHLQLIVTGMHLDPAHGKTVNEIRKQCWRIDAAVPWKPAGNDLRKLAEQSGLATARLAGAYSKLNPDIVLVVGDRVEAFAAATAAHLSGKIIAHVHGGDRALGQVDDALRHAITKLSHIHFPATQESAQRIAKLGEEKWRIRCVGSPGIDGITREALAQPALEKMIGAAVPGRYALLVLHPTQPDNTIEQRRASMLLQACIDAGFARIIVVAPNNDPGSEGIIRAIMRARSPLISTYQNLARGAFLGLMRDAALLIGNSSSGIIEAASFGTPVVDIGPRQAGRERGPNVISVPFERSAIRRALKRLWNQGNPRRFPRNNIYGAGNTARRIASALAAVPLDGKIRRKLIAY
jgi:UDP-N-acetylglucosamine 2-epimerase (non-hydrolysing)/GDP/UDP-N,N'-diacetylbacillosamine 2-epimerase (hydrolysing)